MTSETIKNILDQLTANDLLTTSAPPLMPDSTGDLRMSYPSGQTDSQVTDAALSALRDGQTHYVDVPGIAPLREAVAGYLSEAYGTPYALGDILITAGVQEARFLTLQKIGQEFENILIPEVIDPGVRRSLGTRRLPITMLAVDPQTMLPTLETIREGLEVGGRLLYLESPSRLSGKAYDSEQIAELARLVKKYEATVIWDQGLAPWHASGNYSSLAAADDMSDRVVLLGEAWPGAGLDSWFIGYIATPSQWFEPMRSQKQIMAICTATASQYAALKAAQTYPALLEGQREHLHRQQQSLQKIAADSGMSELSGDTVSIIALKLPANKKEKALAALAAAGYRAADGADFGVPGLLRLTITGDQRIENALQSLT
jgi:arginine:pyruvate transaminase